LFVDDTPLLHRSDACRYVLGESVAGRCWELWWPSRWAGVGGGSAARTERAARGVRGIYLRTSGCGWRSSPSIETNATRSPGSPMYRHPAAA